jgi:putative toxin-antitoxin system antitoxin component (TIGR02293 family)
VAQLLCHMCAMLAVVPPAPVSGEELSTLADLTESLMVTVQTGGLTKPATAGWAPIEERLAGILDSAIVVVPGVARRLVAAYQRLGWRMRTPGRGADVEDQVIDDLETVLECLLAYDEGRPVAADRSVPQLIEWLTATLGLSQARVAGLIGVSLRTLQRWLGGQARPGPEDTARVRRLARLVNQARFALTPDGVIGWLSRPTAYLEGRAPRDLVTSPDADADAQIDSLTATLRYA